MRKEQDQNNHYHLACWFQSLLCHICYYEFWDENKKQTIPDSVINETEELTGP